MKDLLIGVLEVIGVIVVFLGIVYLLQRSHKGQAKAEPAAPTLMPKLKGNYLLAFRLSVALMVLSLIGFAVTQRWLFVWIGAACFVV